MYWAFRCYVRCSCCSYAMRVITAIGIDLHSSSKTHISFSGNAELWAAPTRHSSPLIRMSQYIWVNPVLALFKCWAEPVIQNRQGNVFPKPLWHKLLTFIFLSSMIYQVLPSAVWHIQDASSHVYFAFYFHLAILTLFFFLVACCGPLSCRMPGRPRGHPAAALLFLWLPTDSEHRSGWGHGPPPAPVLLPPASLQELADFGPGRFGVPLRYCTLDAVPSAIMAGTVLLSALWNAICAEK